MEYADLFTDDVLFSSGRLEDLELGGQRITDFDKHKEYAKRNVAFAEKCIQKRIRDLGMTQNFGFDAKRIFFGVKGTINPCYIANHDIIAIPSDSSLSLNTLVHEMLHAYSSEWQGREQDKVEARRHKKTQSVSSGFSINIGENRFFEALNEGITDAMMFDILEENKDELIKVNNANSEIRDEYVLHLRNSYGDDISKIIAEAEKIEKKRVLELKQQRDEDHKENVDVFKDRARENYRDYKESGSKELYDIHRADNRSWYEFSESRLGQFDHFLKDGDKLISDMRVELTKTTRDFRLKTVGNTSNTPFYTKEVELVYAFVDMIAYSRITGKEPIFDSHKQNVWDELQQCYLKGNLIGLRRLCNEINQGKLFFDAFSKSTTSGEDIEGAKYMRDRVIVHIQENYNPDYQKPEIK